MPEEGWCCTSGHLWPLRRRSVGSVGRGGHLAVRIQATLGCTHKVTLPKRYSKELAIAEQEGRAVSVECPTCKRDRHVLTHTRHRS